jgi:hypothetical protein
MRQPLGAEHYKTFQIASPISTHTREATCEEVECAQYLRGWAMKIDLGTPLGQKQAYYIKHQSGRKYRVVGQADGLVHLEFAPNQPCFQQHRTKLDRPEIYRVRGGKGRENPLRTPTRTHKKPEFWLEEFSEHQSRVNAAREKG